jgi:hypothetical protein
VRYEIAIAESPAGGSVGAEVFDLQSVRLRQREHCRANCRNGRGDQDWAVRASFSYGSRSPENNCAGDTDTQGALREPVVRGEKSGAHAPQEEKGEQSVGAIKGQRPPPREQKHAQQQRHSVEHELLGHEVAIELEQLVWKCDNDGEDNAELYERADGAIYHPRNMLVLLLPYSHAAVGSGDTNNWSTGPKLRPDVFVNHSLNGDGKIDIHSTIGGAGF